MSDRPQILVVGYGNVLRGDDVLGWRVAEAIDEQQLENVRVTTVQQLVPELAEALSSVQAAVFIDAALGQVNAVEIEHLREPIPERFIAHLADPSALLGFTQAAYGRAPQAWWIKIAAYDCPYGFGLSAPAQLAFRAALSECEQLLESISASIEPTATAA